MSQPEVKKLPDPDLRVTETGELDSSEIAKNVEARVPSIKTLPEADRVRVVETIVSEVAYSGPLPPPSMLEQYNKIEPGLANRIVSMAESSLAHEQGVQSRILAAEIEISGRDHIYRVLGMTSAILALTGMLGLVAYLAYLRQPWLAGLFGSGSIGLIVWMFVQGQTSAGKDPAPLPKPPAQPGVKTRKKSGR